MPSKPLRPCTRPGCRNLCKGGRCDECRAKHGSESPRRAPWRAWSLKQYTSYRWKQARKAFLIVHPICECEECTAAGIVQPAEVVDHIKPHRGNAELFWDQSNWQAMAKRCHNKKAAKER